MKFLEGGTERAQGITVSSDFLSSFGSFKEVSPVGGERWRGRNGHHPVQNYQEPIYSKIPVRVGLDTPRDHHVPRHGHRRG